MPSGLGCRYDCARSPQTDPTLRLASSEHPGVSIHNAQCSAAKLWAGVHALTCSSSTPAIHHRFQTLSVPSSSVASAMLSQNQTTISRRRESLLDLSTNPSMYSSTNSCKFVCIPHSATGLRFHYRKYANSILKSAGSQTSSTRLSRYHHVYDFLHVVTGVFRERERQLSLSETAGGALRQC